MTGSPLLLLMTGDPMPAFDLNFMGGMPAGLTYTNSSTARAYWDATGTRRTAVANEPIFETLGGVYQGMRWEMEARTNLATNSEGAAATWTVSNVTDAGTPITGFAASLAFGNNSVLRTAYKVVTAVSGTVYTVSTFIQMDDGNAPVVGPNSTTGDFVIAGANLIGGSSITTKLVSGAIYRVSATFTSATSGGTNNGIIKYTTQSARTFRVIGMQVEAAASASSYIQTAGSAVTRQPDVLTATSISPWYRQDEGTVVFEGVANYLTASLLGNFAFSDGSDTNRITQYIDATGKISALNTTAGVNVDTSLTANTITAGSVFRSAHAYKLNNFGTVLNAGSVVTDTSGAPATITQLRLGARTFVGVSPFMGYARRFQYYNRRLTNSEIQGLSRV